MMKISKFLVCAFCAILLAGCGPQVGEDSGDDVGSEPDMSWAVGFFHSQTSGTGMSRGLLQMFELRSNGSARTIAEDCMQGVFDLEEYEWRAVDEDHVEVLHPGEESFEWIRGIQESVILTNVGDGLVHANDSGSRPTVYVKGKLCVTGRPENRADCPNFFDVEVCEDS